MLFPIGANDDMAHSQNEKIDVSNYMNGMKCLALYLDELSTLPENPIEPAAKKGKSNKGTNISDYSRWRKRCKKDQMRFGCDCLDC